MSRLVLDGARVSTYGVALGSGCLLQSMCSIACSNSLWTWAPAMCAGQKAGKAGAICWDPYSSSTSTTLYLAAHITIT